MEGADTPRWAHTTRRLLRYLAVILGVWKPTGPPSPHIRSRPDDGQPAGETCKVDLGIFWRAREPVVLDIGPVLHPDDAAAGKMDALFNRWAPRDFLDVYAIHLSGRYDRQQLEALLLEHNPGFGQAMFAESLGFLARVQDREFEAYGVDKEYVAAMRAHFAEWRHELGG